jgi:hypothetical protein
MSTDIKEAEAKTNPRDEVNTEFIILFIGEIFKLFFREGGF